MSPACNLCRYSANGVLAWGVIQKACQECWTKDDGMLVYDGFHPVGYLRLTEERRERQARHLKVSGKV